VQAAETVCRGFLAISNIVLMDLTYQKEREFKMWNSFWRGIPEGTSEALALCVCLVLLAITILSVVVVYNVNLNLKDNLKNLCGNGITSRYLRRHRIEIISTNADTSTNAE
jgi:hypothetical protein